MVSVPPDILDNPTSADMVVREGSNVSLRCATSGYPAPNITWKRENGELIPLGNGVEGEFIIIRTNRFINKGRLQNSSRYNKEPFKRTYFLPYYISSLLRSGSFRHPSSNYPNNV